MSVGGQEQLQAMVTALNARREARDKHGYKATGLNAEDFTKLQRAVATLRDNLIKSVHKT